MAAAEREQIAWASRLIAAPRSVTALRYAVAASPGGVMLESAAMDGRSGRYSIFAVHPARSLAVGAASETDPFEQLASTCRPWGRLEPEPELPFVGGWIGYLGYEAGRFVEPSAGWRHPGAWPVCQWALFDTAVVHDGVAEQWYVVGVTLPRRLAGAERPSLAERLDALEQWVAEASPMLGGLQRTPEGPRATLNDSACNEWNCSREDYLGKVERALEYIRAGDIFQVNLARRCHRLVTASPVALYDRLCAMNPAAYAAFIQIPAHPTRAATVRERSLWSSVMPLSHDRGPDPGSDRGSAILSSSPELFLRLVGRDVTTRPIKGTRPRGRTPDLDDAAARELAASEKDRAELNMIIDLERNDLGRVCEYGSVRVLNDGEIEMHPTVIHRAATVAGRLREVREGILAPAMNLAPATAGGGADAIDLLRATFPGGSITGAPKVRAMQIIDELEPEARGPYCGAIGYLGVNGDVQLNLAIRTMVARSKAVSRQLSAVSQPGARPGGRRDGLICGAPEYEVSLYVGSGIVADSDPEAEYEELQAKAAGMLAALGSTGKESPALRRPEPAILTAGSRGRA